MINAFERVSISNNERFVLEYLPQNYKDKDGGKIVVYTTSMGIVRSTYAKCQMVKKILNTLMVKFEERDVFMSQVHQQEIRDRMQSDEIDVPQLFVNGQYIGVSCYLKSFFARRESFLKQNELFKFIEELETQRRQRFVNTNRVARVKGSSKVKCPTI